MNDNTAKNITKCDFHTGWPVVVVVSPFLELVTIPPLFVPLSKESTADITDGRLATCNDESIFGL